IAGEFRAGAKGLCVRAKALLGNGDARRKARMKVVVALPLLVLAFAAGCQVKYTPADSSPRTAGRVPASKRCADKSYKADRDLCAKNEAEDLAAQADWAEKQKQFDAAFADEIAAFHAMEPALQSGEGKAADDAEALRARFVTRCIAESGWSTDACWNGTFA